MGNYIVWVCNQLCPDKAISCLEASHLEEEFAGPKINVSVERNGANWSRTRSFSTLKSDKVKIKEPCCTLDANKILFQKKLWTSMEAMLTSSDAKGQDLVQISDSHDASA